MKESDYTFPPYNIYDLDALEASRNTDPKKYGQYLQNHKRKRK